MTRRTLSPPDLNPEGISPGDWVKRLRGKGIGKVESITNDHALVAWIKGGKQGGVPCVMLCRVPPDARPDLDHRRGK